MEFSGENLVNQLLDRRRVPINIPKLNQEVYNMTYKLFRGEYTLKDFTSTDKYDKEKHIADNNTWDTFNIEDRNLSGSYIPMIRNVNLELSYMT